ncbi:MAG: protease inhibitor I42 family protein [Treponema sp.]|jgi:predicted secreted protein|nr:protease inhibitor I42 family protein [Treponema sp.]
MKNLVWGIAILLAACAGAAPEKPQPVEDIAPVPVDLVIELPGNITTGYSWSYTSSQAGIIREKAAGEYVEGAAVRAGAGGSFTFVFEPLKPGTTTLRFSYARPWESRPPSAGAVYVITVDQSLGVSAVRQ